MTALAGRTVFVTGGSGVLGRAIVGRLAGSVTGPAAAAQEPAAARPSGGARVFCLTRRNPVEGATHRVPGDVTLPRLGLDPDAYRRLASQVDAVIHAAAVTDFHADPALIATTNVSGVRHVTEFAAAAGAPLYHVSTAFVASSQRSGMSSAGLAYADSKRAGEEVVRTAGIPHVVLRPSIVIGDSRTGAIARFQGIYYVASAVLNGALPVVPFGADWLTDVVPQDHVADVLVDLLERDVRERADPVWLTAGPKALTVGEAIDEIRATAPRFGRPEPPRPRYVSPDLYQRLLVPVFLPSLPAWMRRTVVRLFDYISPYLVGTEPYPTDLAASDPREAFTRSLDHWAVRTGYAGKGA